MTKRISLKKKRFDDLLYRFLIKESYCIYDGIKASKCHHIDIDDNEAVEICIPCAKKYLNCREEQ